MLLNIGEFTLRTPEWVNILSHGGLLIAAAYLALRTSRSGDHLFTISFLLFTIGEIIYVTYHLDLTELLFVYLIGDGLIFVALIIFFIGLRQRGLIKG